MSHATEAALNSCRADMLQHVNQKWPQDYHFDDVTGEIMVSSKNKRSYNMSWLLNICGG